MVIMKNQCKLFFLLLLTAFFFMCTSVFGQGVKRTYNEMERIIANDIPHVETLISNIDYIFRSRRSANLELISTVGFKKSKWYKELITYIKEDDINFNYRRETATQKFQFEGKQNGTLVVKFNRSMRVRDWKIGDAYIVRNGINEYFIDRGFDPLAHSHNFIDFLTMTKNTKAADYYGMAPHGKLGRSFLKSVILSSSDELIIRIFDIIIHKNQKVIDVIYFDFVRRPVGNLEEGFGKKDFRSGWLIKAGGLMPDIIPAGENIFLDILYSERDIELNKPNITVSPSLK